MKNYALLGAAGYIAPRHMKAIKESGGNLVAALDPCDSVGVIDSFFPEADFFTEFERFDRHLDKLIRNDISIDYLVICSPNYLHDAHIRFGLRIGANVICEKPLVLNPWNVDALEHVENETGQRIFNILQLRLHPEVIKLKDTVDHSPESKVFDIDLTYLTSRGKWYYASWKGDSSKSGGIATNIGIHFFDMLLWIFGPPVEIEVHINSHDRAAGYLRLQKARVRWFLSINYNLIPENIKRTGARTYRSLTLNDREFEFSGGFTDLHDKSYETILQGKGFGINEVRPAIELAHTIRNNAVSPLSGNHHPLSEEPLSRHPFESGN